MIAAKQEAADGIAGNLRAIFAAARLVVDVDVIVDERPTSIVIGERSGSADLSLIGLPDPCAHPDDFPERLARLLSEIETPTPVAFVLASNDVDLEAILD